MSFRRWKNRMKERETETRPGREGKYEKKIKTEKEEQRWTTHTLSERDRGSPSSYCNAEIYLCSITVQSLQQPGT